MPWVKIDDHFDEHPKLARVGPLGWALWFAGLAYCNRNLTDGFIPWAIAGTLVSWDFLDDVGPTRIYVGSREEVFEENAVTSEFVIALLLGAGVWEEATGGYRVHDYDQYQPTKAAIEAERATKVAAGQAGGIAAARARAVASAVAQSKPVPVPVPVPVSATPSIEGSALIAREDDVDGERPDIDAFIGTRFRLPTQAQRGFMDVYCQVFDETGPDRAAKVIWSHPDDPIGALKEDLAAFREERRVEAIAADVPRPRRVKGSGMSKVSDELAKFYLAPTNGDGEPVPLRELIPEAVAAIAYRPGGHPVPKPPPSSRRK